jgi:hypothetical protein
MKQLCVFFIVLVALLTGNDRVQAQSDWKFEFTPYAWFAGIDGDVTVGDRTAEVDVGFGDLFDAVDIVGSFLTVTQYQRWVFWGQLDYFALDSDNLDNSPDIAKVESDTLILTVAGGYQFDGFVKNSTIDVLGGIRYANMENTLSITGIGTRKKDRGITDAVLVLRPSFQLMEKLRFNPTMSIGTGDSDLTWELQPQLQYAFTEHVAARVGYRRLAYDVKGDNVDFDGTFHGFILGVGFIY